MSRKHEFELELNATPERVWQTISEGQRIAEWFAPNVEVKPGESITLSWGPGMEGTSPVHAWEEGKRLAWKEGEKVIEYVIEGGSGTTRLRLTHSGFGADAKFDDEYDATHGGWLTFLAMLKHSAEQPAASKARNVAHLAMGGSDWGAVWAKAVDEFAFDPSPGAWQEGQQVAFSLDGAPMSGTLLRSVKPGYVVISVNEWGGSLLSLFVEKCGGAAAVTMMVILRDGALEQADQVKAAVESVVNRIPQ